MMPEFVHFRGALYTQRGGVDSSTVASIVSIGNEIAVSPLPVSGWMSIVLKSHEPLLNENERLGNTQDTYLYTFFYRQGQDNRFLLVSNDDELNRLLLDRSGILSQVTCPDIPIPALVDSLTKRPTSYVMSTVYARVEGYGEALRTIGFFGKDIGEALLFRDIGSRVIPTAVQLRDAITKRDVMSVRFEGTIRFRYQSQHTLRDIDTALRFLSRNGFLHWRAEESE